MHRLFLSVAHIDEPLPEPFLATLAARFPPLPDTATLRQQQKWKSRRLAHFLLHQACLEQQLDPGLLDTLRRMPNGRPYVQHDQVDFNLSHSGQWVALLFAYGEPKKRVGIDIEHPQKPRDYAKLLRRYASPAEIDALENPTTLPALTTPAQRFYASWCLREAVLKAQGVGIVQLTEVQHSPVTQTLRTRHCPSGKLVFHADLPFHLAYFIEQEKSVLCLPELRRWHNGQFLPMLPPHTLIYQVN